MAKSHAPLLIYKPRNGLQRTTGEVWDKSRLVIIKGPAGVGKTTAALGQALIDVLAGRSVCVTLSRPMVTAGEESGFLPGDLAEKLGPWMAPFQDVMGDNPGWSRWPGGALRRPRSDGFAT